MHVETIDKHIKYAVRTAVFIGVSTLLVTLIAISTDAAGKLAYWND